MDTATNLPIYESIKRHLRERIEHHELMPGSSIPSEHQLARNFDVSRSLARQALRELELEGYIERSQGRCSRVADVLKWRQTTGMADVPIVGLALERTRSSYTQEISDSFVACASMLGYQTLTYSLCLSNETEFKFLHQMASRGNLSGLGIWLEYNRPLALEFAQEMASARFPVVQIDRYVPKLDMDFVVSDNHTLGYELTRALIEQGHTRIALFMDSDYATSVIDRCAGYRHALEEAGISRDDTLVCRTSPENSSVAVDLLHHMLALRNGPTAFFCMNEYSLSIVVNELTCLGYHVPDDFCIASVDDNGFSDRLGVPIIKGTQDAVKTGSLSAEILINRIKNSNEPVQQHFVPVSFSCSTAFVSG